MLGVTAPLAVFNTFLGEEFLFHGILLPKLADRFGTAAWIVSGFLFGLYHMHQPWGIPGNILSTSVFAFAALRFRSTWFSIVLHSAQSVVLLIMILALILGAA
jgi:membrane protease YdiL (CAAX protease family)